MILPFYAKLGIIYSVRLAAAYKIAKLADGSSAAAADVKYYVSVIYIKI